MATFSLNIYRKSSVMIVIAMLLSFSGVTQSKKEKLTTEAQEAGWQVFRPLEEKGN